MLIVDCVLVVFVTIASQKIVYRTKSGPVDSILLCVLIAIMNIICVISVAKRLGVCHRRGDEDATEHSVGSATEHQLNCYRASAELLQSWLPSAQFRHTVTPHVFIEALA